MVDVNNDGDLTALDALLVINNLSRGEGVGELAEVKGVLVDASGNPLPTTVDNTGSTVYTIGTNQDFFYRLQATDLREDGLGVSIATVDLSYSTVGSPDTELLQAKWSDRTSVTITRNAVGGTFTLRFGTQTTAAITIEKTASGALDATKTAENIRVAIGNLALVGGPANIVLERIVRPDTSDNTFNFQFKYVGSLFRVDIPTPTVANNSATSSDTNPVLITTESADKLPETVSPVNNGTSPNTTFTYESTFSPGRVLAIPGVGYLLDNFGGSNFSQFSLVPTGTNKFANIIDIPFRSSTAGTVTFSVGPTGAKAGISLVADDTRTDALPSNLVIYQPTFKVQIVSTLQAVNDTRSTTEGASVDVPVTANDILQPSGGTSFSVTGVTQPAAGQGTVSILANNQSIRYQPAQDFSGQATFTYTITSNTGATSTATVTINVSAVNDAPVPATTAFSMDEDGAALSLTPAQLFTPGPANESTQTVTLSNAALVSGQTGAGVTITGGNLVFTPNPNFFGTVLFTVDGTDNGTPAQTARTTVTVTVNPINDKPGGRTASFTIAEDSGLFTMTSAQIFSPGPSNEGSQTVTVVSATPVAGQTGGTLNFTNSGVTFTPAKDFFGQYRFVTVGRDSGTPALDSDPVTVTINVTGVNDAPVAVNDTGSGLRFSVVGTPNTSFDLDVMRNDNAGPGETAIRLSYRPSVH